MCSHWKLVRTSVVFLLLALVLPAQASAMPPVDIVWVTVEGAGNGCDMQAQGCFGAVADVYRIAEYEVTNAEYAVFLSAVAVTDTFGLYDPLMDSNGGITQAGVSGSFSYTTQPGRADHPVGAVSWYDALRFANWLHNGQPSGAQDSTTTEDGAYTFAGATSVGARNPAAQVFLPNEDEWYKAAYYDTVATNYFDYPAASDTQTTCAAPTATANHANCGGLVGDFSDFGSYTGSASPNGTFDQGGNVFEWTETTSGAGRVTRGGSLNGFAVLLSAAFQLVGDPATENLAVGFRVASPSPAVVPSLGAMGLALLGSLLSLAAYAGLSARRSARRL